MSAPRAKPVLPEAMVSIPETGSQCSRTAKITESTRPSQKLGTEYSEQRPSREQPVGQRAGAAAGHDAQGRSEQKGEGRRAAHQPERVRQPLGDHGGDRPVQRDRVAEIPPRQLAQRQGEAGDHRLIEPVSRPQLLGELSVTPTDGNEIGVHGVAARTVQEQEDTDDDDQQHRNAADQPRDDQTQEARHLPAPPVAKPHSDRPVSAQFDTAQRGLVAMFSTLSDATEVNDQSATLMRGRSSVTRRWNSL